MMPTIGVVLVRHQKETRSVASPTAFYRLLLPKRQTSPYPCNNAKPIQGNRVILGGQGLEKTQTPLEHLISTNLLFYASCGEIRDDVALRFGRPRRLWADVDDAAFGGAVCLARGGNAIWA
jgi:hypothetical protein